MPYQANEPRRQKIGPPPLVWRGEIRISRCSAHGDGLHAGPRLNRRAVAQRRVQARRTWSRDPLGEKSRGLAQDQVLVFEPLHRMHPASAALLGLGWGEIDTGLCWRDLSRAYVWTEGLLAHGGGQHAPILGRLGEARHC